MKKSPVYWCIYETDDNDTLLVSSPDFPEVVTFGEDVPHAWLNAMGAIEEAIAARISDGREIPPPTPRDQIASDNVFWVKLPTLTAQKVLLYNLLPEVGITRAELARQLNWHREQVDRLFRLDHASKADQIDAAFKALGHEVEVSVLKSEPLDVIRPLP
jgi:antitoxin HicB